MGNPNNGLIVVPISTTFIDPIADHSHGFNGLITLKKSFNPAHTME